VVPKHLLLIGLGGLEGGRVEWKPVDGKMTE